MVAARVRSRSPATGRLTAEHPRESIIGACADYLLGRKLEAIEAQWGLSRQIVLYYLRKTGHFRLRYRVQIPATFDGR